MKQQLSLKSLSHHAYLLIGGDQVRDELVAILNTEHAIQIQGNTDFFSKNYENFTIEDSRELKLAHEMRPVTNEGKKIFIITASSITIEAQNALLKLLEEPASYAHFFLIVPSAHLLLPTVKSRLSSIETFSSEDASIREEAKKFVRAMPAKRLEIVKKLLDEITKEKKTKQDAIDFLYGIQAELHANSDKDGIVNKLDALLATELSGKYINDRSPSLKMLLEYVAVLI